MPAPPFSRCRISYIPLWRISPLIFVQRKWILWALCLFASMCFIVWSHGRQQTILGADIVSLFSVSEKIPIFQNWWSKIKKSASTYFWKTIPRFWAFSKISIHDSEMARKSIFFHPSIHLFGLGSILVGFCLTLSRIPGNLWCPIMFFWRAWTELPKTTTAGFVQRCIQISFFHILLELVIQGE